METWQLEEEEFFANQGKSKKPIVNYGPMGPKHPSWKYRCDEVAHQLSRAGRVADQETIEFIALNEGAWEELLTQVKANYRVIDDQIRARIFSDTLSKIRDDAESELRLSNLFGGNTKIIPPQNPF